MRESNNPVYSLDACPEWLQNHCNYVPWDAKGRDRVAKRVGRWQKIYSARVFDSPTEFDDESREQLVGKLLTCWFYHWKCAGVERDGDKVAVSVENGQGFQKGGKLGGNPFFDLALAVALCKMQRSATDYYTKEFGPILQSVATKFDSRLAVERGETPEWWGDFFYFLTVSAENAVGPAKPKLQSFAGKCAMKSWIGKPFVQFLIKWSKDNQPQGPDWPEEGFDAEAADTVDEKKFERLYRGLTDAFLQAKATLEPEDATRVALFYVDGIKNYEIARLFGETQSTASRRRELALERFKKAFFERVQAEPELRDGLEETLSDMRNDIMSLFTELFGGDEQNKNESNDSYQ